MKITKIWVLTLIASVLLLSACQENENLEVAGDLSGAWELTSVSTLEDGQWTTVSDQGADLGILFFERWEDRNQNGKGYRELANGELAEFEYTVSGADHAYNATSVNLLMYPIEDPMMNWQGVYDVVALSSVLTLERENDDIIIKAKRPE